MAKELSNIERLHKLSLLFFGIINICILICVGRLLIFHIFLKLKGLTTFEYFKDIRYLEPEKKFNRRNRIFAVRNTEKKEIIEEKVEKIKKTDVIEKMRLGSVPEEENVEESEEMKSGARTPIFQEIRDSDIFKENEDEVVIDPKDLEKKEIKEVVLEDEKVYEEFKKLQERVILKPESSQKKVKLRSQSNKSTLKKKFLNFETKKIKKSSSLKLEKNQDSEINIENFPQSLQNLAKHWKDGEEFGQRTTQKDSSLKDLSDTPLTKIYIKGQEKFNYQMKAKENLKLKVNFSKKIINKFMKKIQEEED